jgi:hypothetical protein
MFQADDGRMALKPMSCPCHIQIFNKALRSWRELPLRYAEFGTYVQHEFVQILDECRHRGGRALFAFRTAVRARVPGEEGCLRQIQFIHQVRHAARMLMTAMNEDYRAIGSPPPVAKKDLYAVVGEEETLLRSSCSRTLSNGNC